MSSRPPSPSSSPRAGAYFFSSAFERFLKDEGPDSTSALTLLDTVETFFDSHVDLIQRKLQKHSDRIKSKAEETFKIKELNLNTQEKLNKSRDEFEKEYRNFKVKVTARMTQLSSTWQSAKVVRTREKVSFFFGVMCLTFTALLYGMAPEWLPLAYLVQGAYLLPLRVYKYKKRSWHYFLFDLCYYATILNWIYLYILPGHAWLFIACYTLSHGSLASAVITWRNSLVFHDQDKVTSLFIHIYPPVVFTVIRHYYPNAEERFPALKDVPYLDPIKSILISGAIYAIWQFLYWKFIMVDRRTKISSGQRTTSFSFLLNDKRGAIGRTLSSVPEQWREASFMGGQLVYGILTELPAIFLFYNSKLWSNIFLFSIFAVSVWNGGGFYIEVFGRKFERELEALRKELAEVTMKASTPSQGGTPVFSRLSLDGSESSMDVVATPDSMKPTEGLGLRAQSLESLDGLADKKNL
ncbi:hypothetical protein DL96DRAFT_953471 [Flagelloscypha sp. PMI_526]|nr:hypothetical protein DL96DRAFT_953471 [Flagelloscypha sp. PMI_526]